jgi:hypothetical protein
MVSLSPIWAVVAFVGLALVSCTNQDGLENASDKPQIQAAASPTLDLAMTPTTAAARAKNQPSSEPAETGVKLDLTAELSPTPPVNLESTIENGRNRANANVLYVKARQESQDTWHFSVTVEHPDTGWEDYADGWDIVLPDGSVAKPDPDSPFTRLLLHPQETEQPFTRSQGGIVILHGITFVIVRAHDLVDGFGGREVVVDLMSEGDADYDVQRLAD